LFGLIIGPLGLYIRRRLDETAAFLATQRETGQQQALTVALAAHVREALATFGATLGSSMAENAH
jgi:hypothetical protein